MTIAVAAVTQQRQKCGKLPGCMLCGPVKQVCNLFRLAAGLKHLLVMQDSVHNSLCAQQLVCLFPGLPALPSHAHSCFAANMTIRRPS